MPGEVDGHGCCEVHARTMLTSPAPVFKMVALFEPCNQCKLHIHDIARAHHVSNIHVPRQPQQMSSRADVSAPVVRKTDVLPTLSSSGMFKSPNQIVCEVATYLKI